jgi:hypothetical protein
MAAPTLDPHERDPATVSGTETYRHADKVWVYRDRAWCAGVVELSSPRAATVTYRPGNSRGTGVDTLTARYLLPRDEVDPLLDNRSV